MVIQSRELRIQRATGNMCSLKQFNRFLRFLRFPSRSLRSLDHKRDFIITYARKTRGGEGPTTTVRPRNGVVLSRPDVSIRRRGTGRKRFAGEPKTNKKKRLAR